MTLAVDELQIEAVIGDILKRFENRGYPYNLPTTMVPQDLKLMPKTLERGSKDHASFFVALCYYMRGGTKSTTASKWMGYLYDWVQTHGEINIFDFNVAKDLSPTYITDQLRTFSLGFQSEQIGRFWVENARRISELWGGDPRAMFEGVEDYPTAYERTRNDSRGNGLLGFQHKMVCMLLYYLMYDELIKFFYFPVPVDLHFMRISTSTEMVRVDGRRPDRNLAEDGLEEIVRHMLFDFSVKHNINPMKLCDAIWLLGSTLCGLNPSNQMNSGELNGRSTKLDLHNPTWSEAETTAFERSCGSCPVRHHCKWDIPSQPYYRWGQLLLYRERQEPPVQQLFSAYAGTS